MAKNAGAKKEKKTKSFIQNADCTRENGTREKIYGIIFEKKRVYTLLKWKFQREKTHLNKEKKYTLLHDLKELNREVVKEEFWKGNNKK